MERAAGAEKLAEGGRGRPLGVGTLARTSRRMLRRLELGWKGAGLKHASRVLGSRVDGGQL